jgi:GTP pyrophosphokinase
LPGSKEVEDEDVYLDDVAPTLDDTHHTASEEPEYDMAECCEPIPGDKVVGYRDPKSGRVVIHKSTCDKLIKLAAQSGDNIIGEDEIKWSQQKAVSYLATIEIQGLDRAGVVLDITKLITTDFNINMRTISIHSHDGIFEGTIGIYVKDIDSLNVLLDNIRHIKGVDRVKRLLNT